MAAKHAKELKLPTTKSVLEAIGPLAQWYIKFRPDVKAIAVDPLQMMRIEKMLADGKPQGFSKHKNGRVYFGLFRVYVGRDEDGNGEEPRE